MGASHQKRPALGGVVHVTQKICDGLPGLRTKATFRVIADAVRAGNEKPGFRVVAFSVLSNHFHYVVESRDRVRLAHGMQGLAIRVAKALNRHWGGRRGKVFRERFFARALRTLQAMRRAFVYVLHNARRHGIRVPAGEPDPFSSGPWFRFWRGRPQTRTDPSPVAAPRHPTLELVLARRLGLDERPRSSWTNILILVERIAPTPALLPADAAERALMFGFAHEILAEAGLCWSRRLQLIHAGLQGDGGFAPPVAQYLGKKYGYRPDSEPAATRRVVEILGALATRLRVQQAAGSGYFIGETLTALDIYSAAAMALILPMPPEHCDMHEKLRTTFEWRNDQTEAALEPILIEHRDRIYAQHLELPLSL
jgi:glutathione S-transferase/REP element-mobilizing transposase RayT